MVQKCAYARERVKGERERESEEESGKLVSEREVIKGEEKGIRERS